MDWSLLGSLRPYNLPLQPTHWIARRKQIVFDGFWYMEHPNQTPLVSHIFTPRPLVYCWELEHQQVSGHLSGQDASILLRIKHCIKSADDGSCQFLRILVCCRPSFNIPWLPQKRSGVWLLDLCWFLAKFSLQMLLFLTYTPQSTHWVLKHPLMAPPELSRQ